MDDESFDRNMEKDEVTCIGRSCKRILDLLETSY